MTARHASVCDLIADIGGTHARFALLHPDGTITDTQILTSANTPDDVTDCLRLCRHYIDGLPTDVTITRAAWAVAGPIAGDVVVITNRGWRFSQDELRAEFGWREFYVLNDFAALALSLPHLTDADKILIKPARDADGQNMPAVPVAPLAVIGPGTGLGVAGLVPLVPGGWQILPSEGGHVTLPATNAAENDLLVTLQSRFDIVSAEHVLSGRGLVYLAQAMDPACPWQTPQDVVTAATDQTPDPQAVAVLAQFCAYLGTVAGDAALMLGARGGVYLAGGILPKLVDILQSSDFNDRFIEKYATRDYVDAIPVWLITHPLPAFIGLDVLLKNNEKF